MTVLKAVLCGCVKVQCTTQRSASIIQSCFIDMNAVCLHVHVHASPITLAVLIAAELTILNI